MLLYDFCLFQALTYSTIGSYFTLLGFDYESAGLKDCTIDERKKFRTDDEKFTFDKEIYSWKDFQSELLSSVNIS